MKTGLIPINIRFDLADKVINVAQTAEAAGVESLYGR